MKKYSLLLKDAACFLKGRASRMLLPLFCCYLLSIIGCQPKSGTKEMMQLKEATDTVAAAGNIDSDSLELKGKHEPTGLVADEGYLLVRNNCGGCHSLDLVTNKRASREGWLSTIRWMQQTQGLWDLGSNEKPILDYLAKNYAPQDAGRRRQLTDVEWYILEE